MANHAENERRTPFNAFETKIHRAFVASHSVGDAPAKVDLVEAPPCLSKPGTKAWKNQPGKNISLALEVDERRRDKDI
jgi:hypothetical protein